jgi:transposase
MYVEDHHALQHLEDLAQAISEKRLWRRVQTVILAKQGRTASDISQALNCSLRAVKNWVDQYKGFEIS